MEFKCLHRIMTPAMAILIVIVSLFGMGQAIASEKTVMVYKTPT